MNPGPFDIIFFSIIISLGALVFVNKTKRNSKLWLFDTSLVVILAAASWAYHNISLAWLAIAVGCGTNILESWHEKHANKDKK